VNNPTDDPSAAIRPKLEITRVVIDVPMGLFSFTYADGITEHMELRDHSELPTVSAFLTALTTEVAKFGRPQQRPATGDRMVAEPESPPCRP
jgi:hypothetical protein